MPPLLTLLVTTPAAFAVGVALHRLLYARVLAAGEAGGFEDAAPPVFRPSLVLQNGALLIWSADLQGYSYLATPVRLFGTCSRPTVWWPRAWPFSSRWPSSLSPAEPRRQGVRALMQEPDAPPVGIDVARLHGRCFGAGIAMSAATGSLVSLFFELTPFMGLPIPSPRWWW